MTYEVRSDIVFFRDDAVELKLDVYLPLARCRRPRGGVLALHGGGWCDGSNKDPRLVHKIALPLVRRGHVVVSPSYRFAPKFTFPDQLDDLRHAIAWMRSNATQLHIDPEHIAGVGGSAGGQLIGLLACRPRDGVRAPALCRAVLLLSIVDMDFATFMDELADSPLRDQIRKTLHRYMGHDGASHPERWHRASVLSQAGPGAAPMFLVHGDDDDLVPAAQVRRLATRLQAHGVEVHTRIIPNMTHDVDEPRIQTQLDRALDDAWDFLTVAETASHQM